MSKFELMKFRIDDATTFEIVQKELFSRGYFWANGYNTCEEYDPVKNNFLYTEIDGRLLRDGREARSDFEKVHTAYKEMDIEVSVSFSEVERNFVINGVAMSLQEAKDFINKASE